MSTWVSDETWAQLRPAGARLTTRGRVALCVAVVAFAVLASALGAAVASGFAVPKVTAVPAVLHLDRAGHSFTETVKLQTDGWFDEDVVGVGVREPNAYATVLATPTTIPRNGVARMTFRVLAPQCERVNSDLRLDIHLRRPWGAITQTVEVRMREDPGSPFNNPASAVCRP